MKGPAGLGATSLAPPEIIVANARIATGDMHRPWVTAIAVSNGTLAAVGAAAEILKMATPATRIIDAAGATLRLPQGTVVGNRIFVSSHPSGAVTLHSVQLEHGHTSKSESGTTDG